jgi:DnaK suppressor protein
MNINQIKDQLEEERTKILLEISNLDTSVKSFPDADIAEEFEGADVMNNKIERFKMRDELEEVLKDIDITLGKIKKNKYGLCENCKLNIEPKRLEMYPFAKYCTKCMDNFENEK